jgi:hypothetical protein
MGGMRGYVTIRYCCLAKGVREANTHIAIIQHSENDFP